MPRPSLKQRQLRMPKPLLRHRHLLLLKLALPPKEGEASSSFMLRSAKDDLLNAWLLG